MKVKNKEYTACLMIYNWFSFRIFLSLPDLRTSQRTAPLTWAAVRTLDLNFSSTETWSLNLRSQPGCTHGGGDGLCRARLLKTQLEVILSGVIGGDRDGGAGRVSAIFVWQLRRQIEQILIVGHVHELSREIRLYLDAVGMTKNHKWTFLQP